MLLKWLRVGPTIVFPERELAIPERLLPYRVGILSPSYLWGVEGDWRLNSFHVAGDLVNHAYVMECLV